MNEEIYLLLKYRQNVYPVVFNLFFVFKLILQNVNSQCVHAPVQWVKVHSVTLLLLLLCALYNILSQSFNCSTVT